EYFREFTTVLGEPRGIDAISVSDVDRFPSSYRITTKGRRGHIVRVTRVDRRNQPLNAESPYSKANKPGSRIEFAEMQVEYGDDDRVHKELDVTARGEPVWARVYAPCPGPGACSKSYFIDANETPMAVRHIADGELSPPYATETTRRLDTGALWTTYAG